MNGPSATPSDTPCHWCRNNRTDNTCYRPSKRYESSPLPACSACIIKKRACTLEPVPPAPDLTLKQKINLQCTCRGCKSRRIACELPDPRLAGVGCQRCAACFGRGAPCEFDPEDVISAVKCARMRDRLKTLHTFPSTARTPSTLTPTLTLPITKNGPSLSDGCSGTRSNDPPAITNFPPNSPASIYPIQGYLENPPLTTLHPDPLPSFHAYNDAEMWGDEADSGDPDEGYVYMEM